MIILRDYINKMLKSKIKYECRLWGKYGYSSCWIMKSKKLFLDMWILIGNEYFYHNIKICRCLFSNSFTFCNENAIENVYKLYGKKWYIPVKKGSGEKCCNIIVHPNINNSIIKNYID